MSPNDRKKRFESLMPSRTETPSHKKEVLNELMGSEITNLQTDLVYSVSTPKNNTKIDNKLSTSKTNKENLNALSNEETDTIDVYENTLTKTKDVDVYRDDKNFNIASVIKQYEQEKKAKKSYDELYAKHTFVIRKDLISRLEKISKRYSRGFKTKFINELLEAGLNQLEEK
ncbi:hypothetical protein FY534_13885 (plasmid) [Alicyclobacillus sp. TC]|uniref:Parvulin-like peptidyl-prolyl isomerase n=1 Tax=Alicyclobacillus tolerans TaxID=90970 RepID=A0ABT9LYN1_9BACL|nr:MULTISPECIES: hypothetical protein [Alicyclobacillus]MDP9729369.1 parvulin-like peptidyl-prolyl isomerase [Alicyclobacillus tengchongensis]QRF24865.1 hypothetical protein FY534_13885 [Alicyclobacillus sp. TC]